jgi:hypothetical protein
MSELSRVHAFANPGYGVKNRRVKTNFIVSGGLCSN